MRKRGWLRTRLRPWDFPQKPCGAGAGSGARHDMIKAIAGLRTLPRDPRP